MAKGSKKIVEKTITLTDIVAATKAGTLIYTFPEVHEPLIAQGFAEINPEMLDGEAIATRATQAGIDYILAGNDSVATTAKATKANLSSVAAGIPMPESKLRIGRKSAYPFDTMEVGASFFVADEDGKDASVTVASVVSNAHAKFAVPDPTGATRLNKKGETVPLMVKTKTFSVRAMTDGAAWGEEFAGKSGAGVWRVK